MRYNYLLLLFLSYSWALQDIELINRSSCNLKLVYTDVSPSISSHKAPSMIGKYSSGVIKASFTDKARPYDIFVDQYLATCSGSEINLYIIGHTEVSGWVASMEINDILTFANPSFRNVVGEVIESPYTSYNAVVVTDKD